MNRGDREERTLKVLLVAAWLIAGTTRLNVHGACRHCGSDAIWRAGRKR
jgi:hypothetical protein